MKKILNMLVGTSLCEGGMKASSRTWGALGDLRSCGLIIILRHGAPLLAESDSWFSHYS